jgi:hypothetical protein
MLLQMLAYGCCRFDRVPGVLVGDRVDGGGAVGYGFGAGVTRASNEQG